MSTELRPEPAGNGATDTAADQSPQLVLTEDQVMELIAYLTSSAELSLHEPDYYGSLRLLDAVSRLISAVLEHNPQRTGPFLESFKREVDEKKVWSMWDREAYFAFTRSTPAMVATELLRLERERNEEPSA